MKPLRCLECNINTLTPSLSQMGGTQTAIPDRIYPPAMEQTPTKALHSQVNLLALSGSQVFSIMLPRSSLFRLCQLPNPSAHWLHSSSHEEETEAAGRVLSVQPEFEGRCGTAGSFFNHHQSTCPLVCSSSRRNSLIQVHT